MASKEQVERILDRVEKAHPVDCFKKIDQIQVGIGSVLRLLHGSDRAVTAGMISDTLKISTARVAVLLKKMAARGLISKEQAATDGRVTVVRLTPEGSKTISEMQEALYAQAAHIIDTVGEERILEFITIAEEIRAAMQTKDPE